jgi:hypothetical protein
MILRLRSFSRLPSSAGAPARTVDESSFPFFFFLAAAALYYWAHHPAERSRRVVFFFRSKRVGDGGSPAAGFYHGFRTPHPQPPPLTQNWISQGRHEKKMVKGPWYTVHTNVIIFKWLLRDIVCRRKSRRKYIVARRPSLPIIRDSPMACISRRH